MDRNIEIIKEAAKRPATTKSAKKVEDPNEVNRKLRGLAHRVGYTVHAGLNMKGGAGYRGQVVKIDKDHTFIKVSTGKYGDRIVKAPHHLVSVHEETVSENAFLDYWKTYKSADGKHTVDLHKDSYSGEHHLTLKTNGKKVATKVMSHDEAHASRDAVDKEAQYALDWAIKRSKMHEETVSEARTAKKKEPEETKEVARAFRKFQKIENEREAHDERRKHHHEHERKMHREEADPKVAFKNLGEYMRRRAEAARKKGDHEKAAAHDKTAAHWERLATEETFYDHDTGKEREVEHYHIISKSSGKIVGKAKTKASARRVVDKRDNEYGSYNHTIKPVFKEETNTDKRTKVSLVGRPNDPPVTSKDSVLHKTLQIKNKIID